MDYSARCSLGIHWWIHSGLVCSPCGKAEKMSEEFRKKAEEMAGLEIATVAESMWLMRYRTEILALYDAARELKAADDDIVGIEHEDCSKPPCSGCRHDDAMDVMEEVLYELDRKAGGDGIQKTDHA